MSYRPTLDQQFVPRDATSRFDCAATSGAILIDAETHGALNFTHGQVRAKTGEPIPDPASPGLNWSQIDLAANRLTFSRVNLDVHSGGSSWAPVSPALRAGRWAGVAVWRGTLVDAGYGAGNTFRGAHAETYGWDADRKLYIMGDSLVPHWIDVPLTVMARAARDFLRHAGYGANADGAYFALTPGTYDVPGPTLRYSALFSTAAFWRYEPDLSDRKSLSFAHATSAPCDAPVLRLFNGVQKKLVRVQKGSLAGFYVEPGNGGCSLKVSKA